MQQHVHRKGRRAVQTQLATEGVDVERGIAAKRARHRDVEAREAVGIHRENHIARGEIEAVQQRAQFGEVSCRGLQLRNQQAARTALQQAAKNRLAVAQGLCAGLRRTAQFNRTQGGAWQGDRCIGLTHAGDDRAQAIAD